MEKDFASGALTNCQNWLVGSACQQNVTRSFNRTEKAALTILFLLEEQELVWQENSSQFGSTDALQHDEGNKVSPLSRSLKDLGPVSRKSRNFSGVFRVTQFSLYLQNEGVSRHETLQLFLFLFPLQHIKRPALQNKQVVVLGMAFRAQKASCQTAIRFP